MVRALARGKLDRPKAMSYIYSIRTFVELTGPPPVIIFAKAKTLTKPFNIDIIPTKTIVGTIKAL